MTTSEPPMRMFLARLTRLDPRALVRLRPDPPAAWAMLPFRVLVTWPLDPPPARDVTYRAADLLAGEPADLLAGEPADRRDAEWRWPLPPSSGRPVETIPAAEIVRLAQAAARTVRTATTQGISGRAVGERALRDALLDHVAIAVTTDAGEQVQIPQRVVQGLVRVGLLGVTGDTISDGQVTVSLAMGWIGLSGRHGSAWYRPISPLRLG